MKARFYVSPVAPVLILGASSVSSGQTELAERRAGRGSGGTLMRLILTLITMRHNADQCRVRGSSAATAVAAACLMVLGVSESALAQPG